MGKKQDRKAAMHPEYREVVFIDTSTGVQFVCGTALKPKGNKTVMHNGKELPVCDVSVSSSSHPLFTGQKFVDTEGRISKFNKRYGKSQ